MLDAKLQHLSLKRKCSPLIVSSIILAALYKQEYLHVMSIRVKSQSFNRHLSSDIVVLDDYGQFLSKPVLMR